MNPPYLVIRYTGLDDTKYSGLRIHSYNSGLAHSSEYVELYIMRHYLLGSQYVCLPVSHRSSTPRQDMRTSRVMIIR